jgi:hypothetical protein
MQAQNDVPAPDSSGPGDDGVVVPGSPPPIGTGRTDVNPADEAGVDELPDDDGALDTDEHEQLSDEVPDIDPDNAEVDGVPNPR